MTLAYGDLPVERATEQLGCQSCGVVVVDGSYHTLYHFGRNRLWRARKGGRKAQVMSSLASQPPSNSKTVSYERVCIFETKLLHQPVPRHE